jgi:hypothetical protein
VSEQPVILSEPSAYLRARAAEGGPVADAVAEFSAMTRAIKDSLYAEANRREDS